MKTTQIKEFEAKLKKDIDGYFQCPECDFEDKRDAYYITQHYEMEHEL